MISLCHGFKRAHSSEDPTLFLIDKLSTVYNIIGKKQKSGPLNQKFVPRFKEMDVLTKFCLGGIGNGHE